MHRRIDFSFSSVTKGCGQNVYLAMSIVNPIGNGMFRTSECLNSEETIMEKHPVKRAVIAHYQLDDIWIAVFCDTEAQKQQR